LHPDLVERLAQEAAKTASHMLHMCIRALDYCPPVDVTFGDYLRALITADAELVTNDRLNYRLAIIEAFRRRGIYPRDVRSLSEESLRWDVPSDEDQDAFRKLFGDPENLRTLVPEWGLTTKRKVIYDEARKRQRLLRLWLRQPAAQDAAKAAHLIMHGGAPATYYRPHGKDDGPPSLEAHSVRPARRIGPGGQMVTELVIELTQRRRGYLDSKDQQEADAGNTRLLRRPDFIFRGGCTLLVDLETAEVRYCIYKRIGSSNRLERQRRFLRQESHPSVRTTYFGDTRRAYYKRLAAGRPVEPLALLHRSFEPEEVE
jgi:hypothetical protein